jgi:receptor protein-tyrosine kinase
MSRVHDALKRAGQAQPGAPAEGGAPPESPAAEGQPAGPTTGVVAAHELEGMLDAIEVIPYTPSPDASLIDASRPQEAPMEEFRSLRTRLNHLRTLQPISSLVITSPSPAEGKSFTTANLALAQAQLEGSMTLLADFDFRRPVLHNLFQIPRSPGMTDYLQGKATLEQIIKRVDGMNLCVLPAGEAVLNPLELLNLPEVKHLIEVLPKLFTWVLMDTPPLLFAADANLLSTLSHGTILVVRMGSTTIDTVTRALQSMCENNILGIVVNAAQKSELYSKYTYYHSYYYSKPEVPE